MPMIDRQQKIPLPAQSAPLMMAPPPVQADPSGMGSSVPSPMGTQVPNWLQNVLSSVDQSIMTGLPGMQGAVPQDPSPMMIPLMMLAMAAEPGPDVLGPIAKKVGSMLPEGVQQAMLKAFHGSPYNFDKFSDEAIGTGQGAQTFGYGHYLAEEPNVANNYRKGLSREKLVEKARNSYDAYEDPGEAMANLFAQDDLTVEEDALLQALAKEGWLGFDYPHQAIYEALNPAASANFDFSSELLTAINNVGKTYEVGIKAEPEDFLDLDKPLTEQSDKVKTILIGDGFHPNDTGKDAFESWMQTSDNKSDLTDYLKLRGLKGIRYLDQHSRAAGQGTSNYVVFSAETIEILRKYGLAGLIAGGAGANAMATKDTDRGN